VSRLEPATQAFIDSLAGYFGRTRLAASTSRCRIAGGAERCLLSWMKRTKQSRATTAAFDPFQALRWSLAS